MRFDQHVVFFHPSGFPAPVIRRFVQRSLLASIAGIVGAVAANAGSGNANILAVYSSASPDYVRTRLPDGALKVETYAFGEGGRLTGDVKDGTIDSMSFLDIAHAIAPSLRSENIVPCDPNEAQHADLLIMVYWGTTISTDHTASGAEYQIANSLTPPPRPPAINPVPTEMEVALAGGVQTAADNALEQSLALTGMANHRRDQQNTTNASILGYRGEMERVDRRGIGALRQQRQNVVDEIEEGRYYVVLMAYDFQLLQQQKGRKLLWETRFSIPQGGNRFSAQLGTMAQAASRYYGRNSDGLMRKPLPNGHVEMGETKSLGPVP